MRKISYLFIFIFFSLSSKNSHGDDYEYLLEIIRAYRNDNVALYFNGCTYEKSPRGDDEAFLLLMTNRDGELFSIREDNLYREASIIHIEEKNKYFYDTYGGYWNKAYITDIINHLINEKLIFIYNKELKDILHIIRSTACNVKHDNLESYISGID